MAVARRLVSTIAPLSLTLALGCGGSGDDGSRGSFAVESFSADGLTGVERNRPLVVTFTAPVDPASVSAAGFLVRRDGESFPVRAVVEANVVTLHPAVLAGDRNDFVPPNDPPPNGLGFPEKARLDLEIAGSGALAVRDLRGRELGATFRAPFATGSGFAPEEPAVAPVLAALPAFNQVPRNETSGSDLDPRDPETAPEFDPRDLRVSLAFSEPMEASAFDPFGSFTVTNMTPGFRDFGREIPGEIVADGEARVFTFVPMIPLGDDPDSAEPLLFRIRLEERLADDPNATRRLHDLAGNPLEGNPDVDGRAGRLVEPIDFYFRTVDAPTLPRYGWFTETFDDGAFEDRDRDIDRRAIWGEDGLLRGAPPVRSVIEVAPPDTGFPMPEPLAPSGNRVQLLYFKDGDLSPIGASTLVALEWGPRNNTLVAATYAGMSLTIGHTDRTIFDFGLSTSFALNFRSVPGSPVRVFEGDYSVPGGPSGTYHPWPAFQNVFEYDGVSNLVLDLDVPAGGAASQSFRAYSPAALPRRRIVGPPGATTASPPGRTPANTTYHHRFTFVARRSLAVSRLVDTGAADPLYLEPLVHLGPASPATSHRLTFEAENAFPGAPIPDGLRLGPFDDVASIEGIRFFSFQLELTGDLESTAVPLVESLTVAWEIR